MTLYLTSLALSLIVWVIIHEVRSRKKKPSSWAIFCMKSIRVLLFFTGFVLMVGLVYVYILTKLPWTSTIGLMVAMSSVGIFKRRRSKRTLDLMTGSIFGGVLSAILLVMWHIAFAYADAIEFEDEGVGLLGSLMFLIPLAVVAGSLIGIVTCGLFTSFKKSCKLISGAKKT